MPANTFGSSPPPARPGAPPPGEATAAAAGTEDKIEALGARAARREPLFHPGDNLELGRVPDPRTGEPRSLPKGVTRKGNRYVARATLRGAGRIYLGTFATEDEAREAVEETELEFRRALGATGRHADGAGGCGEK